MAIAASSSAAERRASADGWSSPEISHSRRDCSRFFSHQLRQRQRVVPKSCFVIWTSVVYVSVKIPLTGLKRYSNVVGAELARDWGLALAAALIGLCFGVLFLSMTYHPILWIFLGLSGAYHGAVRRHDPDFRVTFGYVDLALVAGFCALFPVFLHLYLFYKHV